MSAENLLLVFPSSTVQFWSMKSFTTSALFRLFFFFSGVLLSLPLWCCQYYPFVPCCNRVKTHLAFWHPLVTLTNKLASRIFFETWVALVFEETNSRNLTMHGKTLYTTVVCCVVLFCQHTHFRTFRMIDFSVTKHLHFWHCKQKYRVAIGKGEGLHCFHDLNEYYLVFLARKLTTWRAKLAFPVISHVLCTQLWCAFSKRRRHFLKQKAGLLLLLFQKKRQKLESHFKHCNTKAGKYSQIMRLSRDPLQNFVHSGGL